MMVFRRVSQPSPPEPEVLCWPAALTPALPWAPRRLVVGVGAAVVPANAAASAAFVVVVVPAAKPGAGALVAGVVSARNPARSARRWA